MFLFDVAHAQSVPSAGGLESFGPILPIILVFLVMYFMAIRPQQKKAREQQAMLGALKKGDKVMTNGGIFGTIDRVLENKEVHLIVADNVKIRVAIQAIAEVNPQGTALKSATKAEKIVDEETPVENHTKKEESTEEKKADKKTAAKKASTSKKVKEKAE